MAEKLDYTNPCPRCGDAAMPEKYRVLGCAMNYACESMVSTEGLFIAGRPCLLRQLAAANERAGRYRSALRSLVNEVGASAGAFEDEVREAVGNTNYACLMDKVEQARKALEVPDAM